MIAYRLLSELFYSYSSLEGTIVKKIAMLA